MLLYLTLVSSGIMIKSESFLITLKYKHPLKKINDKMVKLLITLIKLQHLAVCLSCLQEKLNRKVS